MSDKIRIGIIGCGGIANSKHMPSLTRLDDVEMVAFCDLIEERAVAAAKEKFGCQGREGLYGLPRAAQGRVDRASCTYAPPTVSTASSPWTRCEAGKHVMCEKPMAINARGSAEDAGRGQTTPARS